MGDVVSADGCFTKQRFLWQPTAWRLLREAACARYARQVVPSTVAGVRIEFPDTRVMPGFRVTVTTRALAGEALLTMLYRPTQQEAAIAMGLIALEAWQSAAITGRPFPLFSLAFRLLRGPAAVLAARCNPDMLSAAQRKELGRLVTRYLQTREEHRVLVHGDLHASHLVVNLPQSSLGILDLEAMHVGKAATNFAQLWIGYHYAAPELGAALYRAYRSRFPDMLTAQFDSDVRAELALRCLKHIQAGQHAKNQALDQQARAVLAAVLSGPSFEALCTEGMRP